MKELLSTFSSLSGDYTFLVVLAGTTVLGVLCSLLGSFIVLKRESLIGDCLAHSSYPGIILAFMYMGVKHLPSQLLGAFLSAAMAITLLVYAKRITRLPFDGLLATILSTFFGFGIVLMSIVQRMNNANQAGLKTFIFGQASTMLYEDVVASSVLGFAVLLVILFFWKELKIVTFDQEYAYTIGTPIRTFQYMFSFFTILTILLAMQSVGIILMSALLVAPAIAARQWTKTLGQMVSLASLFGACSAVGGTLISSILPKIPTGPSIAVIATSLAILSLLFSPHGVLVTMLKNQRRGGQL